MRAILLLRNLKSAEDMIKEEMTDTDFVFLKTLSEKKGGKINSDDGSHLALSSGEDSDCDAGDTLVKDICDRFGSIALTVGEEGKEISSVLRANLDWVVSYVCRATGL